MRRGVGTLCEVGGSGLGDAVDVDEEEGEVTAGRGLAGFEEGVRAGREDVDGGGEVAGLDVALREHTELLMSFIVLAFGDPADEDVSWELGDEGGDGKAGYRCSRRFFVLSMFAADMVQLRGRSRCGGDSEVDDSDEDGGRSSRTLTDTRAGLLCWRFPHLEQVPRAEWYMVTYPATSSATAISDQPYHMPLHRHSDPASGPRSRLHKKVVKRGLAG